MLCHGCCSKIHEVNLVRRHMTGMRRTESGAEPQVIFITLQ